jgi:hypothetical protein
MSKIKIAGLSLVLLLGGVYYLNKGDAPIYDKPGAKEQMATLVKDIDAWYSATGTYVGAPKGSGAMLAAGDTMWGASKSFKTSEGDLCVIAGDLGGGEQIDIATESKPCTREGVQELQNYICSVEGKTENCPDI